MESAEVYLLLTRLTGPPVLGEAGPLPFTFQIELASWSWEITSLEEENRKDSEAKKGDKTKPGAAAPGGGAALQKDQKAAATGDKARRSAEETAGDIVDLFSTAKKKEQWDKYRVSEQKSKIKVIVGKALGEVAEEASSSGDAGGASGTADADKADKDKDKDKDRSLTITFKKSVDLATTQMLNAMKAGEIFPMAMINVFHRSATTPLLLTVNLTKFRLTSYSLSVDATETLTDLSESWTGEFERFDYVYKNRAPAGMPKRASQAAGVAASQGRIMTFVMKPRGLF